MTIHTDKLRIRPVGEFIALYGTQADSQSDDYEIFHKDDATALRTMRLDLIESGSRLFTLADRLSISSNSNK